MSYQPTTEIKFADANSVDAFGRLRTSETVLDFDSKQIDNEHPLFWVSSSIGGSTFLYDVNRSSTTLTVTNSSGSRAIRQSKRRIHYQPGKSTAFNATFVFNQTETGVSKKIGIFDDKNGIFFDKQGTENYFVIRTYVSGSPTETRVSQSNWNIDKLDGTGISSQNLDFTKIQIFHTDFQWLGAGRVRTGFFFSGTIKYAHEFNFANNADSVYMTTPNLPARYEIDNLSGSTNSDTLEQICCAAYHEGNLLALGKLRGADRGRNTIDIPSASLSPIISIRLAPNSGSTNITVSDISILAITNASFRWGVYINPIIFGSDGVVWQSIKNSAVQFDTSRTGSNTLSDGILVKSGYAANTFIFGGGTGISKGESSFEADVLIGTDIDGNSDEIVLGVEHFEAGTEKFVASLSWKEFI